MNRGLIYLLRKRPVGWTRVVRRRTRRTKGVLAVLGVVLMAALLIGPQILVMVQQSSESTAAAVAGLRLWGPVALTLMALLSASSGAGLTFRQSEIDFLFPAPIGRRELLLYHVLGQLMVVLLSSLWLGIFVLRWAPHWYAGLTGIFFGFAFLQLLSQVASLFLCAYSVRGTRLLRRLVLLGALAACVLGVFAAKQQLSAQATLGDAARAFAGSAAVAVVTAPASVFVEIFSAASAARFALWAAAGLSILVALFALIARLDVAYTEGAVRASQRMQERLRRMRSGGGAATAHAPGSARFSLPAAPWLGGAGPVIWRQGIEAIRSLRGIVMTALMTVGVPVAFVLLSASGEGSGSGSAAPMGLGMIVMMTVFMNQHLALDFRRDLDRMAYLKSLPLPPAAVALGQILPGIVVFTVLQALAITVLIVALGLAMPFPAPLLLLLVPFNWLSMALDNVLFLLFPHRFAPKEAGNVQFMGRAMLVMFAKMIALILAIAVAGLAGWLLWYLGGESLVLGGASAALVLGLVAVMLTHVLGRVFAGFDVTADVPG